MTSTRSSTTSAIWIVDDEEKRWLVMGAYQVKDQKNTAWREYFGLLRQA